MALFAIPDLCNPDRILIRRGLRDNVAEAPRHLPDALEHDCEQLFALARNGDHFPNQSVQFLFSFQRGETGAHIRDCGGSRHDHKFTSFNAHIFSSHNRLGH
jgi:hypothetical protein